MTQNIYGCNCNHSQFKESEHLICIYLIDLIKTKFDKDTLFYDKGFWLNLLLRGAFSRYKKHMSVLSGGQNM